MSAANKESSETLDLPNLFDKSTAQVIVAPLYDGLLYRVSGSGRKVLQTSFPTFALDRQNGWFAETPAVVRLVDGVCVEIGKQIGKGLLTQPLQCVIMTTAFVGSIYPTVRQVQFP